MLIRETVLHCPTCDEVTPHSYRWFSIPKAVSLFLLGMASWCVAKGGAHWIPAVLLLFAAAFRLAPRPRPLLEHRLQSLSWIPPRRAARHPGKAGQHHYARLLDMGNSASRDPNTPDGLLLSDGIEFTGGHR